MVRWAWVLTGGGRPDCNRMRDPHPVRSLPQHMILLLGLACGLVLAWNCLSHHQLDLFVGAAMIGGCLALARSRTYLAALGFGLAAAFKGPALLWGPYLAWRGRWKEALCVVRIFVGLNLLPTLLVPAQLQRLPVRVSLRGMGRAFLAADGPIRETIRTSGTPKAINRSSAAATAGSAPPGTGPIDFASSCRPPIPPVPLRLKGFFLACAALLDRRHDAGAGPKLPAGEVRRRPGLTFPGMRHGFHADAAPVADDQQGPLRHLLVPAFALARWAVYHRSRVLGTILTLVLLAVLCTQNFMGEYVVCVAMWHGAITWAALLLLVGCGCSLRRVRKNDAAERANQRARSCPPPPNVEQGYQWQKWARRLVTRLTRPAAVKEEEHR